jgi:hypothetical protein
MNGAARAVLLLMREQMRKLERLQSLSLPLSTRMLGMFSCLAPEAQHQTLLNLAGAMGERFMAPSAIMVRASLADT